MNGTLTDLNQLLKSAAHQEIVHRLGNLTIASKEWNQNMSNRPFGEKLEGAGNPDDKCYRNSSLRVQRDLVNWEEWNEATIQERADQIIDFAMDRWRVGPATGPTNDAPQP